ncbi:MAG TPA: hypothetical protein PLC37_07945 [Smithellaceae bacterium]|nr:hypothetical protein [Smithellaceae bacterium]
MIELTDKWIDCLVAQPETGMGYHVVSVILCNGKRYDQVVVNSGYITQVKGYDNVPFHVDEIKEIIVTHDKWKFGTDEVP